MTIEPQRGGRLVDALTDREGLYRQYLRALRLWGMLSTKGTPIYERDWDLLVVLDACRFDLLDSVADRYPFLQNQGRLASPGSMSAEWLRANFTTEYEADIRQTAYVTGNPYSESVLDDVELGYLDEVWKYAWDDELGTIRPRPITDRAISVARDRECERLVVHYMQPHYPFVTDPDLHPGIDISRFGNLPWDNVWDMLRDGELDRERVITAYRENLEVVLKDVGLLLNNVDADTAIITADHGNALGEYGIYGHPPDIPLDCIRQVPWFTTSAEDSGNHNPKQWQTGNTDSTVQDRLSDLGYLND